MSMNEGGWQPIETAPKDDSILLWGSVEGIEFCQVAFWHPGDAVDLKAADGTVFSGQDWSWAVIDGPSYHKDCFTHWQPLPSPPVPTRHD